jgi:hypothetical protein
MRPFDKTEDLVEAAEAALQAARRGSEGRHANEVTAPSPPVQRPGEHASLSAPRAASLGQRPDHGVQEEECTKRQNT